MRNGSAFRKREMIVADHSDDIMGSGLGPPQLLGERIELAGHGAMHLGNFRFVGGPRPPSGRRLVHSHR
jgi:hypothetical protein